MSKIILSVLAAITLLYIGFAVGQDTPKTDKQKVFDVCNQARLEISGESEQACGDIQDATGLVFFCDGYNPEATCYVEHKLEEV